MGKSKSEHLKKELYKIYHCKNMDEHQYQVAIRMINQFQEIDPFFFHFNLGKIFLLKGEYEKAKHFLENALEIDENSQSVYYQLYKLDVRMGNYQEAFLDLFKYKELCNCPCDIGMPLTLLEQILDYDFCSQYFESTDYEISKTDYFGVVYINDNRILALYHEMIDLLNQKKYYELHHKINEMNKLIHEMNFCIEVDTIDLMVNQIIRKISKNNTHMIRESIYDINNVDLSELNNIIPFALDNHIIDKRELLQHINRLVDVNLEKASLLLSFVDKNKYQNEYCYLKNKINERALYMSYNDEKKAKYDYFITEGRKFLNNGDFDGAYQIYLSGKCCTNHPIFDYYLGKTLYRKRKYQEAKDYFLKYNQCGGIKLAKSLLYVAKMYRWTYNKKKYEAYMRKIETINNILDDDDKIEYLDDNKINHNSFRNQCISKKLFSDECLVSIENLKMENYYNYPFAQKIALIRDLFLTGKIYLAEQLLSELVPSTPKEKIMLKRLSDDKLLLKTKAKYNG